MSEQERIRVRDVDFGTLVKLVMLCGMGFWVVVAALMAVLAVAAPELIKINDQPATSTAQALIAVPLFFVVGSFFSAIIAVIGAAVVRAAMGVFGRGSQEPR